MLKVWVQYCAKKLCCNTDGADTFTGADAIVPGEKSCRDLGKNVLMCLDATSWFLLCVCVLLYVCVCVCSKPLIVGRCTVDLRISKQ